MLIRLLRLAALALVLFTGSLAHSHNGTVSGTLDFYQNQGNFCQSSVNCTGARYTQASHYGHFLPVRDAKVYVINQGGQICGQGVTNANGFFSFNWSDNLPPNVVRSLIWRYEHKDGRFKIVNMNGSTITYGGPSWGNGASLSLGTITLGNSTAPHALANVYDGARMMWANTLSASSVMQSYFTNVEIRAFEPPGCLDGAGLPIPNCCSTSCASGSSKRIRLDANAAYQPQGRILHELGHIASYLASPGQNFSPPPLSSYCYEETGPGCGWTSWSEEYGSVQFEEGISTHFGNLALYDKNAATPRFCLSAGACGSATSNNLELSLGTTCGEDVNRQAIQTQRYLWDVYDSGVDYTGESLSLDGWTLYTYMGSFGNNNSESGKNEPWNAALTSVVEEDGRSTKDWQKVLLNGAGQNTSTQFANNCSPVGD